jgi:hypothetical protein
VSQTVLSNTQALFTFNSGWVVKANTLNETTIATYAFVSNNDIKKWTTFRAAAGESNDDHNDSFGWENDLFGD